MKLDVSKETYDAQWYKMEGCELKIRPYLVGQSDFIFRDGGIVQSGEDRWKMFNYSLIEWKNVTDSNGKDLILTDDVKRKVFDYELGGIPLFVIEKNNELIKKRKEQEKN